MSWHTWVGMPMCQTVFDIHWNRASTAAGRARPFDTPPRMILLCYVRANILQARDHTSWGRPTAARLSRLISSMSSALVLGPVLICSSIQAYFLYLCTFSVHSHPTFRTEWCRDGCSSIMKRDKTVASVVSGLEHVLGILEPRSQMILVLSW